MEQPNKFEQYSGIIPILLNNTKDPIITDSLLWNLLESVPTNISIWDGGKILYANHAFYNALGLERGSLEELNRLVEFEGYFSVHPDDFDFSPDSTKSLKDEIGSGVVFHREMRMKSRMDAEYRWYNTYIVKGKEPDSKVIIEIDEDINDKKLANDELRKALEEKERLLNEKEILLREIHHRVKNNFQVISSLLSLQSKRSSSPELKLILDESRSRITSMAKIHEKLYRSDEIEKVSMKEHLRDVVDGLVELYNGRSKLVRFTIDVEDILLPLDKAIPCSLILNELVSNCLKYAFNDYEDSKVSVKMKCSNKDFELSVKDNGKGLPEGFSITGNDTLGLLIVNTLAAQINGEITFENCRGASFTVKFPACLAENKKPLPEAEAL